MEGRRIAGGDLRLVARVERKRTRERHRRIDRCPDFAALNPGYNDDHSEEKSMRISAFVALILMAAGAFAPRPAAAAYNLQWCANYYDSNIIACSFTSFEQCLASVSGVGGHCIQNILYPPRAPYSEPPRVRPRRLSGHD